jgi:hypothetical protein
LLANRKAITIFGSSTGAVNASQAGANMIVFRYQAFSSDGMVRMLASQIQWILIASGIITLSGGIAAFLSPVLFLRLGFGVKEPTDSALFFVRHWGVLVAVVGALIIDSADAQAIRTPILIAAAAEKFAIGLFVFFGRVKRTRAMTAIATADGIFAILYAAYLAGI